MRVSDLAGQRLYISVGETAVLLPSDTEIPPSSRAKLRNAGEAHNGLHIAVQVPPPLAAFRPRCRLSRQIWGSWLGCRQGEALTAVGLAKTGGDR